MARMSSSSSKAKNSSGLRILWIPGRKKYNRKGTVNSTKQKNQQFQPYQLKKNEPWSLGGTTGHSRLIHTDIGENVGAAVLTTNILGATTVVAANAGTSTQQPPPPTDEGPPAEEDCDKQNEERPPSKHFPGLLEVLQEVQMHDMGNTSNEGSSILSSSDHKSTDFLNTATLAIGQRRRNGAIKRNEDLDSIEHLADANDGATGKQFKKKSKKKKKNKRKNDDNPDEDKLVTCLYYSMVCCGCTIS